MNSADRGIFRRSSSSVKIRLVRGHDCTRLFGTTAYEPLGLVMVLPQYSDQGKTNGSVCCLFYHHFRSQMRTEKLHRSDLRSPDVTQWLFFLRRRRARGNVMGTSGTGRDCLQPSSCVTTRSTHVHMSVQHQIRLGARIAAENVQLLVDGFPGPLPQVQHGELLSTAHTGHPDPLGLPAPRHTV